MSLQERAAYLKISLILWNPHAREHYSSRQLERQFEEFKPEYLGKMDFYLEALDRDVRRPNENPSVGVILCASKDDEVVEYAMSRSMSPTFVSEYALVLPDMLASV